MSRKQKDLVMLDVSCAKKVNAFHDQNTSLLNSAKVEVKINEGRCSRISYSVSVISITVRR